MVLFITINRKNRATTCYFRSYVNWTVYDVWKTYESWRNCFCLINMPGTYHAYSKKLIGQALDNNTFEDLENSWNFMNRFWQVNLLSLGAYREMDSSYGKWYVWNCTSQATYFQGPKIQMDKLLDAKAGNTSTAYESTLFLEVPFCHTRYFPVYQSFWNNKLYIYPLSGLNYKKVLIGPIS